MPGPHNAATRLRSTPILSPASRTIGADSMIPPGVGSMPIISGIAARATRRLRNSPCIAGTSRAESPICPMASPTTLTSSSRAVSETNR